MCLTFIYIIPNLVSSPKNNEASPRGSFHLPFGFLVINCREEFYDRPTHLPVIWQRRLNDSTFNSLSAAPDISSTDISSNNSDFFHLTSLLGCSRCISVSEQIEIKNYCLSGLDLQEGREGGTWFGISVLGDDLLNSHSENSIVRMRMGALLNVSVGDVLFPIDPSARGRGHLVGDFLSSARAVSARDYITQLERSASTFPPFNLILAELRGQSWEVFAFTNYPSPAVHTWTQHSGVLAFGSSPLSAPFTRVHEGGALLERLVREWAASRASLSNPNQSPNPSPTQTPLPCSAVGSPSPSPSPVPQSSSSGAGSSESVVHVDERVVGDGDGEASFREAAHSLSDWLLGERFLANTTRFGDSPPDPLRDPSRSIIFTNYPPYRHGTRSQAVLIVDPSGDRALFAGRDLQLPSTSVGAGLCAGCKKNNPSSNDIIAAHSGPEFKPLDLSSWRPFNFFLRVPSTSM